MAKPYTRWGARYLEEVVEVARVRYVLARDARQPSAHLWNEYARKLHTLRLRKRSQHDAT